MMKVYILEFDYFDKVAWKNSTVKITALSKIQLIKKFISEYCYSKTAKLEAKQILKNNIIHEEYLTFPLIEIKEHYLL